MKQGFVVKIIPPEGYSVYRLHFTRQHLIALGVMCAVALLAVITVYGLQIAGANARVADLQAQREAQQQRLETVESQTQSLQKLNAESQREIDAIKRALGEDRNVPTSPHAPLPRAAIHRPGARVSDLQSRLRRLASSARRTHAETLRLHGLAVRVLNMRHLASIARERLIASIPSLNPVDGEISAGYGYRTNPFPEFHKGVDLAVDYGTIVRAAAAGTIASAGWDGGCGIMVDIDHGNGYHTWYCHLSRANVSAGQRVLKGQPIALVGSTGESTGPHLHYQVMLNGQAVDPQPYLTGVPPKVLASLPDGSSVP